jgi:hypothetical protein
MSSRSFFRLAWAGCLALLAVPALQASPLQYPKRVIDEHTVDLSPLFHWWTNHHGSRPLTGWVHVTGSVTDSNAMGWMVEARVDDPRHAAGDKGPDRQVSILLRNPPVDNKAEFDRLKDELNALNAEHSRLTAAEAELRTRAQAMSKEQRASRRSRGSSQALTQASRANKQSEARLKQQLKPVDQQLQQLKTRLAAYPNSDHYIVDCFALESGSRYNGAPVYDHGMVWK